MDRFGILGLLAVDGGGLKAHEGRHAEGQGGADAGREQVRRRQAGAADAFRADGEGDDVEDDDRQEFQPHKDADDLGGQVHLVDAQPADNDEADQRAGPPGDVEPELGIDKGRRRKAEEPVDADLHRVVGNQRHPCGADPGGPAQALGNVGVKRAGVADVRAHGRVADGEQRQADTEHDERQRDADVSGDREVAGDAARDHRQRRGGGDDHEDKGGHAERALAQPLLSPLPAAVPADGRVFSCDIKTSIGRIKIP